MISFSEQTATFIEFVLVFAGLGFLIWFAFSPGGRALRANPAALRDWRISPTDFVLLGFLVFVLGVFGQIFVQILAGAVLRGKPEGETLELVVSGSMFHAAAIVVWLFACALGRRIGPRDDEPPGGREGFAASLRDGSLTFLGVVPLVSGTGLLWEKLLEITGLPTARQELVDYFAEARSPVLLGILIVLALVVAPVSEELVFRVGLFRYLRSKPPVAVIVGVILVGIVLYLGGDGLRLFSGGAWRAAIARIAWAIAIALASGLLLLAPAVRTRLLQPTPRWIAFTASAGLFALLHANWISALPLFVLGVVFALAYERTGRVAVPMFAHALFNLNTLLLVLSHAAI